jgi:hypothetical protein
MHLHSGGGCVVARARPSLLGQLVGTGIRHRRAGQPSSCSMVPHRVAMIEATLPARLMPGVRRTTCIALARLASVDLTAILGLAHVENDAAPPAANRDQNAILVHARTSTAAHKELAPPSRLQAPSPGQRPRATRRLREPTLGLHPCAPSMGAVLRVQVPPRGGHPDRSEPQLREGDQSWEGSGERNRGATNRNRVRGVGERSERACDREAAMTKAQLA